jgi:hypothetical protein
MERASVISFEVIKSVIPLVLKAFADLQGGEISASEEEVLKKIKEGAEVKDLEIYRFMDQLMTSLLRIKVAYHIDWSVTALALKDHLTIFEEVAGYRGKYDARIKEIAANLKPKLKDREIADRQRQVNEIADSFKRAIQEDHKETKEKIKVRKK